MSLETDDKEKKIDSRETVERPSTMDENSSEFMMLSGCERIEETLVVGEEIVVDEHLDIKQQIFDESDDKERELEYIEETIEIEPKMEYPEPDTPLSTDSIVKEKWLSDDSEKHSLALREADEGETDLGENQDGDEETIATFVTAAGQQLALYAVEDSDEIFAVAVYDESGDPPTNFQFLMKADVERLIGEGAVRTVKKPTQIKKQLLTTQPAMFFSKHETTSDLSKILTAETQRIRQKGSSWSKNSRLLHSEANSDAKQVPNIVYTTDNKQSDVTYVMMKNCSVNIDDPAYQEDVESDNELVEQSTVQYILFEGDQSDSELTFDEIQATLQNLKSSEPKSPNKPGAAHNKPVARDQTLPIDQPVKSENSPHINSTCSLSGPASNALAERKSNFLESRRLLLETLEDTAPDSVSSSAKTDLANGSIERASPESVQTQLKTKRSRKQQLISVNRDDSEIIIQPASLLHEEDNSVTKKGKRRRRVLPHADYRPMNSESRRMKKIKRKEVEIIEIDVDEEESALKGKGDVVEITIDDSKDKYSSDKENEIIMVGDSDDESQQSDAKGTLLKCQHCSRNFRQQRALETHLRVCSKSPTNAVRFSEQKVKRTNRESEETVKKQYACKICQKMFDVVVALARHVRSEHSQRKKRRFSKSSVEQEPEDEEEEEKEVAPAENKKPRLTMVRRVKRRKCQRPNSSWEVKKLSCTDCGRWFPSAALLRAHCLQHGTKNSKQQIRRCQVCKKLIKGRLLFLRHLKVHGNLQKATKSVANIQKKLHTTRSVTRTITSIRKRGRPRKL